MPVISLEFIDGSQGPMMMIPEEKPLFSISRATLCPHCRSPVFKVRQYHRTNECIMSGSGLVTVYREINLDAPEEED